MILAAQADQRQRGSTEVGLAVVHPVTGPNPDLQTEVLPRSQSQGGITETDQTQKAKVMKKRENTKKRDMISTKIETEVMTDPTKAGTNTAKRQIDTEKMTKIKEIEIEKTDTETVKTEVKKTGLLTKIRRETDTLQKEKGTERSQREMRRLHSLRRKSVKQRKTVTAASPREVQRRRKVRRSPARMTKQHGWPSLPRRMLAKQWMMPD